MFKGNQSMNLVMLDIDGTLTQSYDYDREVFGTAIAETLGCPPIDADLNRYIDKTSTGVTLEAIERITGRSPTAVEVEDVKRRVLKHFKMMYNESPGIFSEVPGAALFLKRLRKRKGMGTAIATGCWYEEAVFKLEASGLSVGDIPMATSDDDRNRKKIMEIAVRRAQDFYACSGFERIIYIGDGPWDLQASRSLGYSFVGIGPRLERLKKTEAFRWHQDFIEIVEVFNSIAAVAEP
jgi:phosphoglycolate phosphatase-like HAD superfamily hydrolase